MIIKVVLEKGERKVLRESCPRSLRLCWKKKGSEGKLPMIIKVVQEKERL
jgi:hypothetical protein